MGVRRRRLRPPYNPQTPLHIRGGNLVGWFDLDDARKITFNGPDVSDYKDKSNVGTDLDQTTASEQPNYYTDTQNGRRVLSFSTGENLENTGFSWPTGITLFAIIGNVNWTDSSYDYFISSSDFSSTAGVGMAKTGGASSDWEDDAIAVSGDGHSSGRAPRVSALHGSPKNNKYILFKCALNPSSANIKINGKLITPNTTIAGSVNASGFVLGRSTQFWAGRKAEAFFYNIDLVVSEVYALERYANKKWGVY